MESKDFRSVDSKTMDSKRVAFTDSKEGMLNGFEAKRIPMGSRQGSS